LFDGSLDKLSEYVHLVSEATGAPIPRNYPVFGEDAFRTATGVHAAAIIKALRKGDRMLADGVYSGVPAHMVGERQSVEIGYMSGASNVNYWLETHGIATSPDLVQRILQAAKESTQVLSEAEVLAVVRSHQAASRAAHPA
jgi:2-isopropylmalate synthase